MKVPKKTSLFISFAFFALGTHSCQEHDSITSSTHVEKIFEHVTVSNNALHFDAAESVPLIVSALSAMKEVDRRNWESLNGFTSMYSLISDVHRSLNNCTTHDEYADVLYRNRDLVTLEGDEVKQLIPLDYFTLIINREGLYYVDRILVKITPTAKIYVLSGDIAKLKSLESKLKSTTDIDSIEAVPHVSNDVIIAKYVFSSKLKSDHSQEQGKIIYTDRVNSDGDRKVKFWIIPWRDSWLNHECDQYWQWRVEVKIENQKKLFGTWNFYATTCYWEKTEFNMYQPLEQSFKFKECGGGTVFYDPYYWAPFVVSELSWSSGNSEVERHSEIITVGSIIQNNPLPLPSIINARGRATNRGMGGQFAGICEGGFKSTNNCLPTN